VFHQNILQRIKTNYNYHQAKPKTTETSSQNSSVISQKQFINTLSYRHDLRRKVIKMQGDE